MYSKLDRANAPASTPDGPEPSAWTPAGAGSGSCARAHPDPAPFRPIASRRSRIGSRSVGRPGRSRGPRRHAPMPAAGLPVSVGRSGWRPTETGPERSSRSSRTRHPGRGLARSNESTVRERGFGSSSLDPSVRSSAPAPSRSVGNAPAPRAFPRLATTPREHRNLKRRSGSCERLRSALRSRSARLGPRTNCPAEGHAEGSRVPARQAQAGESRHSAMAAECSHVHARTRQIADLPCARD